MEAPVVVATAAAARVAVVMDAGYLVGAMAVVEAGAVSAALGLAVAAEGVAKAPGDTAMAAAAVARVRAVTVAAWARVEVVARALEPPAMAAASPEAESSAVEVMVEEATAAARVAEGSAAAV